MLQIKLTLFQHIPHNNHIMETHFNLNLNHQQQQQQQHLISFHDPIQHMFEKPLTPSDVGKLNRLVIPKQHAETYFPLINQHQGSILVTFEDEYRKLWRFRYSYWNSSQSYVFTKGWTRFVKEKRLDAGDIVLFQRHMLDCSKMFIGWRRRAQPLAAGGGGDHSTYPLQHVPLALPLPYQLHDDHARDIYENVDAYQRRVVATRRLRLFGVNLECPADSEPPTPHGSSQGDHQYNFNFDSSHHDMVSFDEFQVMIKLQVI